MSEILPEPLAVSVVIPVYNRLGELLRAIDSVLTQTYRNFELIVVDDGSTRDLSRIMERVEAAGQYWISTVHAGVSAARNIGIRSARGRYVALLDSDDRWLPRKLERQLAYFESHPELRIAQCLETWHRGGQRVNPKLIHAMPEGDAFLSCLRLCCISPSAVILDRQLFSEFGLFDELLPACEDYDLWLRITAKLPVGLLREPLTEKCGGQADQLSRSVPVLDRYRVYALQKLVDSNVLSPEQTVAALGELLRKSEILANAGRKKGAEDAELFDAIRTCAASRLKSIAENSDRPGNATVAWPLASSSWL